MGIVAQQVSEALKTDALYTRVKETDNKLHYSVCYGLLLAQNTNGYKNLYIPVGPLEKGVSLRDFILMTVHEGLGHFSAYKCYSYAACFFWWPQMRQDLSSTVGHAISARLTASPPPYPMDDPLPFLTPTKSTNP